MCAWRARVPNARPLPHPSQLPPPTSAARGTTCSSPPRRHRPARGRRGPSSPCLHTRGGVEREAWWGGLSARARAAGWCMAARAWCVRGAVVHVPNAPPLPHPSQLPPPTSAARGSACSSPPRRHRPARGRRGPSSPCLHTRGGVGREAWWGGPSARARAAGWCMAVRAWCVRGARTS